MGGVFSYHLNGDVEILFLKVRYTTHLCFSNCSVVGSYHPFILIVIVTMNDGNHTTCKRRKRRIYAKDVGVLLLAIAAEDALDIAVVDGIYECWMVGMCAT